MTTATIKDIRTHAVEERAAMAFMDVRLRQVSGGEFLGHTQTTELKNIKAFQDTWNRLITCNGTVPEGYIAIGAPRAGKPMDWCGSTIGSHSLAVGFPGTELDYIIPADTTYSAVVLPTFHLKATFGDHAVDRLLKSDVRQLRVNHDQGSRFLDRIDNFISTASLNPESPIFRDAGNAFEAELMDDLAELGIFSDKQPPVGRATSRDILRKACNAAELLRERVTVPQFAAQINVGQRNLELAFKRHLGTTPRRYLSYCRMQQAYRDLRSRSATSHCVTEVAGSWGFTELGRFSGEYRKLFGELPSETLKRPPLIVANRMLDLGTRKAATAS